MYLQAGFSIIIDGPSTSSASAGFFFKKKKDGSLRPYIGNCGLNVITQKARQPLPLMNLAFDQLQQDMIFTNIDLRSKYNLVCIRAGDEWKSTFITPSGYYKYFVMTFGLMNAPVLFQHFINEVLRKTLNHYAFVYLNDILIFSNSLEEHVVHICQILHLLLENHLYIKHLFAFAKTFAQYCISSSFLYNINS